MGTDKKMEGGGRMQDEFGQMLKEHAGRYPLMAPQDYAKLAYQSEFGPEHMAGERRQAVAYLAEEWQGLPKDALPRTPEAIGGGLCRFPLRACSSVEETELLADLFLLTAQERKGTGGGLAEKLARLRGLEVPGMGGWLTEWERQGCPPVHHSPVYREAYRPHYRLLRTEYAGYFPVLAEALRLAGREGRAMVSIDGRCGSGKTRLAELIARLFPCNVLHMDDFYLPQGGRAEGWESVPGGNMDFARLRRELLEPLREGRPGIYRAYDCAGGRMGEAVQVQPAQLTVVEGSYSRHPALGAEYALTVFLTCSREVQRRRLQAREGGYFPVFEQRWIPLEEDYFRQFRVEEGSQMLIDTGEFFD